MFWSIASLLSTVAQPLLLVRSQLTKLFSKPRGCCSALEELNKEFLCLIVTLSTGAGTIVRSICHQLLLSETAAEVDKRIRFVFPGAVV
jgi:hypothetical protein